MSKWLNWQFVWFLYPLSVSFSSSSSSGTAPTRGSPGLQNQTSAIGGPGFYGDSTTGAPGLHSTRSQGGFPGVASPGVTGQTGLQKTTISSTGIIGRWSDLLFIHCCCFFTRFFYNFGFASHFWSIQTLHLRRGHHRSTWTASHHKSPFWKTWVANHKRWETQQKGPMG